MLEAVHVDGLDIAYRRQGEGSPLVLLHGGLSDSREWNRQFEAFSDVFEVVAWDAPGCGGSSDPPESFGLHGYADALAGLMDALGLGRVHIVGLSFGAGLALEVYHRHPRLVRSLVLASAYAGWAGSLPPDVVEERLQSVRRQADMAPDEVVAEWLPTLFSGSVDEDVIEEVAAIMRDFHPGGMRAMAPAFARADLRDVLPTIDVPTLLLYGDADIRAPPEVALELHRSIPRSQLVWLEGVGHQANLEAPERFSAEVLRFLRAF